MAANFLNDSNYSLAKEANENPLMLAQMNKGAELSEQEAQKEALEIVH